MDKNGQYCSTDVFREELKEHRGDYYVTYQPADSRSAFAVLSLIFHGELPDPSKVRKLMESEMKTWLNRFRVPVLVSGYDVTEDLIRLPKEQGGSHLMGYVDANNQSVVQRWGVFENEELPPSQMTNDHFALVYTGIPFKLRKDVREKVEREHRKLRIGLRIFRAAFIFIALVPVAIELISLGVTWLAYLLQIVSILTGVYKVAKAAGWVQQSKRTKEDAEKQSKMEHYYYHCERNREAFERLKIENFRRDTAERTRKEATALVAKSACGPVSDASM